MNPTPSQPERPEHNPDNLTPEQYGAPEWRLLRLGETPDPSTDHIRDFTNGWQTWLSCGPEEPIEAGEMFTYRRRVATRTAPEAVAGEQKPKVVCLCGSSKHPELHMQVMMLETLAGNIVIPMGLYGHADFPPGAKAATNDGDESTAVKQMLDTLHHRKIDLADEVLVLTVDKYIGSSTRREIEYANKTGKTVRIEDCWIAVPPTPPVEADKDAEIAKGHIDSVRLADKLLTRTAKGFDYLVSFGGGRGPDVWDNERTVNGVDIHDALSQARGLVEDSDGWIFRIEQNDYPPTTREKLESDLTTAHATIAERDKRIETLVGLLRQSKCGRCNGLEWIAQGVGEPMVKCPQCIERSAALAHAAEGKEQA